MRQIFKISVFLTAFIWLANPGGNAFANSRIDELKTKIEARQGDIKQLEAEIEKYQKELETTAAAGQTLKTEITRLNTTIKKLTADVRVTEQKIAASGLTVEQLALEINNASEEAAGQRSTLAGLLRSLREVIGDNLVTLVFAEDTFSAFWDNRSKLINVQGRVAAKISVLEDLKAALEEKKQAAEAEKRNLERLNNQLTDQKKIVEDNRGAKNELLTQTKNREADYKKILAEKQTLREAFLQELFDYESQLRVEIDPASLPPPGSKILSWPLDQVFITQNFGRTESARRLYVSGTHNGIDLRASPGTPIKAAASGEVVGLGDTDFNCRGASYGRWLMIQHQNGLSTLYAHLSLIKAAVGQRVERGELVGYSGQTGYATGPHLHLTVFATLGVKIDRLRSRICQGAVFTIPMAPPNAYLDPLIYF